MGISVREIPTRVSLRLTSSEAEDCKSAYVSFLTLGQQLYPQCAFKVTVRLLMLRLGDLRNVSYIICLQFGSGFTSYVVIVSHGHVPIEL